MQPVTVQILNWKRDGLRLVWSICVMAMVLVASAWLNSRSLSHIAPELASLLIVHLVVGVHAGFKALQGGATSVRADERGVTIHRFLKSQHVAWSQIAMFQNLPDAGGRTRLRLLDAGGSTRAEVGRTWFESPRVRHEFERLEMFLAMRLGSRAVSPAMAASPPKITRFFYATQHKWLGIGSLFFWVPAAVLSWSSPTGGPWTSAFFGGFAALGVWLILTDTRYEVNERGVKSQNLLRHRELHWEEIRRATFIKSSGYLTFAGQSKATGLTLVGTSRFKPDSQEFWSFLRWQVECYNIEWDGDQQRSLWRG